MSMPPPEYIPYGPEWHAEVMKLRKADIIDRLLRPTLIQVKTHQDLLERALHALHEDDFPSLREAIRLSLKVS